MADHTSASHILAVLVSFIFFPSAGFSKKAGLVRPSPRRLKYALAPTCRQVHARRVSTHNATYVGLLDPPSAMADAHIITVERPKPQCCGLYGLGSSQPCLGPAGVPGVGRPAFGDGAC